MIALGRLCRTNNNWPGETRSYSAVARTMGYSPRAVGGALGGWSGPGEAEGKRFLLVLEDACEADGVAPPP